MSAPTEVSEDAFSHPRSAKRRKLTTYTTKRTTPKIVPQPGSDQRSAVANGSSPRNQSVFQRVTNAVTGIGRRLFETDDQADTNASTENIYEKPANPAQIEVLAGPRLDHAPSDDDRDELATDELIGTPVKVKTASKVGGKIVWDDPSAIEEQDTPAALRTSGRQRRRPRRYSDDLIRPAAAKTKKQKQPELRGILTPSKRKRGRKAKGSGKSVVFQQDTAINALDFEDVHSSEQTEQKASAELTVDDGLFFETQEDEFQEVDITVNEPPTTLQASDHNLDSSAEYSSDISPLQRNADVENLKSALLSRLTHRSLSPIVGLSAEYQKVFNLLSQTVTAGEGNSMLILGPRGVGKTLLVETALVELHQEYGNDYHTIYLNGLLQADDKLALKEIWRQLGREMDIDEDENQVGSYADTLSSLLALLSHPEELVMIDSITSEANGSGITTKSVIFIMDEFDLFASHPRQTLLYNLFDIAQARKAPIAVLGLSTRLDVTDSLEKRVKSRFSQRYIFVPTAKNLDVFKEMCKSSLTVSSVDKAPSGAELDPISTKGWNSWVDELFARDKVMARHLSAVFTTSKSILDFHRSCLLPISCIQTLDSKTLPKGSDFLTASTSLAPPDSILTELLVLTHLQLTLLVCAARFDAIYTSSTSSLDSIAVNFESVYAEYVRLSSDARIASSASGSFVASGTSRIWGKGTAEGAWEELVEKGLLTEAHGRNNDKNVKVEVSLEEIVPGVEAGGGRVPDEIRKWCKDI
ncbi:MAG: hypothetical protein Q9160_004328 [Pyrenula sp. 1 TL-2023]